MRRGSKKNRVLDFWVGIPLLNGLATLRRRRRGMPAEVRRVGVLCSPALGDTLLFSAALQDVRAHFGEGVEIVHFCMRSNLAAAEIIPGADRRVVIDLTRPPQTVRQMRAERLDLMMDFSSWQRLTAFYSMSCGAKYTVGFVTAGQFRGRGYDLTVRHRDDLHEVENFREILRAMRMPAGSEPRVEVPEAAGESEAVEDLVVFHLWASGQRSHLREWPEERWVELARQIGGEETKFAITGAPSDRERVEPFVARMLDAGLEAYAFVGEQGFVGLARLLRQARVVVSVNTGVMHLAAIVAAPTVAINGPNRNGRWGPVGERAVGVEAPGEGCGYLHLGFNFDGQATDCMERISVDQVVEAVHAVEVMGVRRG